MRLVMVVTISLVLFDLAPLQAQTTSVTGTWTGTYSMSESSPSCPQIGLQTTNGAMTLELTQVGLTFVGNLELTNALDWSGSKCPPGRMTLTAQITGNLINETNLIDYFQVIAPMRDGINGSAILSGNDSVLTGAWSGTLDTTSGQPERSTVTFSLSKGCEAEALCLGSPNRFRVKLQARDQRSGRTATGQPLPVNSEYGYFALPALTGSVNVPEVFVKILDGRPVNGKFWVFWGGLTDLEYTFTVRDTTSGASKDYTKEAGSFTGGADTSAF